MDIFFSPNIVTRAIVWQPGFLSNRYQG